MAVGNPTVPVLNEASGEALGGTLHGGTGVTRFAFLDDENSTPSFFSKWMNLWEAALNHLADANQGHVVTLTGLNVGVFAMNYRIGSTDYVYPGDTTFACAASVTNHLYLDSAQLLKNDTTGWPAGDHVKLAKVVTGASSITQVTDCRWCNFLLGIVNAWSSVVASSDVDLAGFDMDHVGALHLNNAIELTIAAGAVTPTQAWHTVDTEANAATDDLVTITADANRVGQLLIIGPAATGRVVTIKSTGNIDLVDDADLILDATNKLVILQQHTATGWRIIRTNFNALSSLVRNLDIAGHELTNIGGINLQNATATLAAGVLTLPGNAVELAVRSEVINNPDNLTSISGGVDGDWLFLRTGAAAIGEGITVEDGTGNISLVGNNWSMVDDTWWLALRRLGGVWYEQYRAPITAEALNAAGDVVPHHISVHYPGVLIDGQASYVERVGVPFTMKAARGRVVTAPSGGSCVVDVFKNGASVFAAQANAINIIAAANNDTSDTITVSFAVNDELTVKVITASGAADLSVSIEAYAAVTKV